MRMRIITCLALVLSLVGSLGCTPESPPPTFAAEQLGPREKFERFMTEFRRLCAEGDSRAILPPNERDAAAARVRVTIEPPTYVLEEPATPTGRYTAQVTVVTRLVFSSVATIEPKRVLPDEEPAEEEKKSEDAESQAQETTDPPELEALSQADQYTDTYDFAYLADRWQLQSTDVAEATRMRIATALAEQTSPPRN